jgi:hypothetical protein
MCIEAVEQPEGAQLWVAGPVTRSCQMWDQQSAAAAPSKGLAGYWCGVVQEPISVGLNSTGKRVFRGGFEPWSKEPFGPGKGVSHGTST